LAGGSSEPPPPDNTPPPPSEQTSFAGGEMSDYSVQRGDTLMRIAYETYGDLYQWRRIYNENKDRISDPNNVPPGVVLKLQKPAQPFSPVGQGEKYLIAKGDTLGKISSRVYGTPSKWKKVWENNQQMIKDPNKIYAGFYLYYIPEDGVPPQQLGNSNPGQDAIPANGGDAIDTSSNTNPGVPPQDPAGTENRAPASAPVE
jgi:nucleoid-associated protein YgaU